ncbi:phosphopantetheine-binding protein [Streptomyces sp. Ncost-T10-10d]|uniref:phosphopantetheine-binding protein n=1 Tax=Streptomyces sp. Ncost-T10-10d TaxID=1839774 RepID=UPI00081E0A07|nr:phosphopantetheine-binding protein [Streptomyces sp. Ncost-T10-10d]SCF86903.1 acyl carrier protein [Streptomyces sp. Ncost-T10-10d]
MPSVLDRITEVLVSRFGVEPEEVTEDTTMRDLDLDSLALVEFALVAGGEFHIQIDDEEVGAESSVKDLIALIDSKSAVL